MADWSVEEVCAHFQRLGLSVEGVAYVRRECVTGQALLLLSEAELRDELKLPLGTRKEHQLRLEQHRPKPPTKKPQARFLPRPSGVWLSPPCLGGHAPMFLSIHMVPSTFSTTLTSPNMVALKKAYSLSAGITQMP